MKFHRNPNVFSKKIGGIWHILEENKQRVRKLNETAGIIWGLTEKPTSQHALAHRLSTLYGKPIEQCMKDVSEFVKGYVKARLLIAH